MERWVGRVALVTGASSGIGAAIAKKLVCEGMKVVGCARNVERIEELAKSLVDQPGTLLPLRCDVSDETQIVSMFERIDRELGGVDVCVNNAGVSWPSSILTGDTRKWKEQLDVNVLAVMICSREATQSMLKRKVDDGHIFFIGSIFGHKPHAFPECTVYSATKYAVRAINDGVRNELREMKSHIRSTCISPGLTQTEIMLRCFNKPSDDFFKENKHMEAADIADSVIYALSAPPHVQVHDVIVNPTGSNF